MVSSTLSFLALALLATILDILTLVFAWRFGGRFAHWLNRKWVAAGHKPIEFRRAR